MSARSLAACERNQASTTGEEGPGPLPPWERGPARLKPLTTVYSHIHTPMTETTQQGDVSSGAVRARCLAQGHLDTLARTSRGSNEEPFGEEPALPPELLLPPGTWVKAAPAPGGSWFPGDRPWRNSYGVPSPHSTAEPFNTGGRCPEMFLIGWSPFGS